MGVKTLVRYCLILISIPPIILAQGDTDKSRLTLRGIKAIKVIVEQIDNNGIDVAGVLSTEQIRTDVELRLRSSKIHIVPKDSLIDTYLDVHIHILKVTDELSSFVATLRLYRGLPISNLKEKSLVCTWDTFDFGASPNDKIVQIRETVKDLTDRFINAFLGANE